MIASDFTLTKSKGRIKKKNIFSVVVGVVCVVATRELLSFFVGSVPVEERTSLQ